MSLRRFMIWLQSSRCECCGKRRVIQCLGSCRNCLRVFAGELGRQMRRRFGGVE